MSPKTAKITATVVSVLTIGGLLALATPAVASMIQSIADHNESVTLAASTPEPTTGPQYEGYVRIGTSWIPDNAPGDCEGWTVIAKPSPLGHELSDMGPNDGASGEVTYNEDGSIAAYTVAAGDALYAIGDRFCLWNAIGLAYMNGGSPIIQPGQVLTMNPDSALSWRAGAK